MADFSNKVIYQIYPKSFKDSNGDGIGDLRGVVSKFRVFPSVLNFREFFAGVCCWSNLYNP